MTPELARMVAIFHLPRKPDARCGGYLRAARTAAEGLIRPFSHLGCRLFAFLRLGASGPPCALPEVGGTQVSSTASRSNVCEILLVSSNQEHRTHKVPLVPRKMASTVILEPPDFNLTTLPVLISFAIVSPPKPNCGRTRQCCWAPKVPCWKGIFEVILARRKNVLLPNMIIFPTPCLKIGNGSAVLQFR
jgi:hypothetical protein